MRFKHFFLIVTVLMATHSFAQITGKFGTYYDQRELLFEAMPTSENDIIFLGNSITDGGEWAELFQNPNCKNRGISGDITSGILNRLETITKGCPAMVFLMIGTNDMNWGLSNDSVGLGVREVVQRIKQESPRTRIIVQSILPTNDCYGYFSGHTKRYADVPIINGMLKAMAEEEGVEYLDLYSHFANEEGKLNSAYSNDGLHINGDGYLLWKEIIETEIGKLPNPVHKNRVPVWLNLDAGLDEANCYDNSTIPFSYYGLGVNIGLGTIIEWGRYHIQPKFQYFSTLLVDPSGSATDINLSTEFLYRFHDAANNRWHFWGGGTLQGLLDIKSIPTLQNASTCVSLFGTLCATGMVQYDFAFNRDKNHHWLTAFGKLNLPLHSSASRPSYANIGNPTIDMTALDVIIERNESFGKFFSGIGTELGLYLNLRNDNRIGLIYSWDYLTTGKKGTYRYDQAIHAINFSFMFKIN